MNNGKQYPFQRNRYYSGKLLTSMDFQAEQDYFNNKSRFMNTMMYGSGILCGLGVVALDDVSILVESGVAIDGMGREIIQETSLVRKLSALEGYENLTSTDISLCIRYNEEQVHSVYSVNRENSSEFEYSRVSENSSLFLMDREDAEDYTELTTDFISGEKLYSDSNFDVSLEMPTAISRMAPVKMDLVISKKTGADVKLTLHTILQLPGLLNAKGNQETYLDVENLCLEEGEEYRKEFWFSVADTATDTTKILLKSDSGRVYIDDELVEIPSGFEINIRIYDEYPWEIVKREMGRVNLEERTSSGGGEYIRLADIKLVTNMGTAIIDTIDEISVKKYVETSGNGNTRQKYLGFFEKKSTGDIVENTNSFNTSAGDRREVSSRTNLPEVSSGVLEIPLGEIARKGDIRYSGEIVHGLGNGNVYVEVGFETVRENKGPDGRAEKMTIFGNADLFRENKTEAPMVETAVKVLNSKGSFVVAAKLLENVDFLVIKMRWVAVKFPSGNELGVNDDFKGKSIVPETPTVVLNVKESYYFGVRFENMESCSLMYELTEEGSGEITSEGIYTAPAKEGVFEIRIYCTEMPMVCAYAYAIVKRGMANEQPTNGGAALDKGTVLDEIQI